MNREELEVAGEIARKVKGEIPKMVYVGAKLLDIAESVEKLIEEEGGKPAFPTNISVNEVAAHYTPNLRDEKEVNEGDLVKVDFGVLYGEAITDTAITVALGKNEKLVETANQAVENAVKGIKAGVGNGEIGKIIEETIRKAGFKPIANLSGHKIEAWNLHAGVDVPNIEIKSDYTFKEGDVFAIEPFVTTQEGAGSVKETNEVLIYSLHFPAPLRMRESRRILAYIVEKYKTLPFAERWIRAKFGDTLMVSAALREMLKQHVIKAYPTLVERNNAPVAQAEHTIVVEEDGCWVVV